MRKLTGVFVVLFISLIGVGVSHADAKRADHGWKQIIPPTEIDYVDANGLERILQPSCSGGPVCVTDPETGVTNCQAADTQFSFFVRQGEKDKLAIMFDGGGACWDSMNCVAFASYTPLVTESVEELEQLGGIADFSNPENPFKDWTMVFVPYCTGDIHWGSKDTQYVDAFGVLGAPGESVTIHHRGWDNFLSVMSWLEKDEWSRKGGKDRRGGKIKKLKQMDELMVMGSSAGGYGALFAYPYLREAAKHADARVLMDGSNGVVTDEFMAQALAEMGSEATGNWNVRMNLPSWIPNYADNINYGKDIFAPGLILATANYYPKDAFGQYTTAWDVSQTAFLNIMQNINNPAIWRQPGPATFCEWHGRMTAYAEAQTSAPNYRYYVAAGLVHTILANPDDSGLFYRQDSAGQPFTDWLGAMLEWELEDRKGKKSDDAGPWMNARCVDCQAPFDPALCGF